MKVTRGWKNELHDEQYEDNEEKEWDDSGKKDTRQYQL